MGDLRARCEAFLQDGEIPSGILEALNDFVTSNPRRIVPPDLACEYDQLEERMALGRTLMEALVAAQPPMEDTITSTLWCLITTARLDQLRSFVSTRTQVDGDIVVTDMVREKLERLLKIFLAKTPEKSDPPPHPSRIATEVEKCLQRDGGCCTITGSATPHVCHIIPFSVTKRKKVTTGAVAVVIGMLWGTERNSRLQALLGDDAEIDSARNAICLSPLLHHWWGRGYIAFEPLEKLHNGTRVRLRWLRRTAFSVWDRVPLDTNPINHLRAPSTTGSLAVVDLRSKHPVLDGSVFDLTSEDPTTEVSHDLLLLQWDLLRMAVLCGAAEAADDPNWNPEDEDPVYAGERLLQEPKLEEGWDRLEDEHEAAAHD